MNPKKKSSLTYIIPILIIILVTYLAMQFAYAYDIANKKTYEKKSEVITKTISIFCDIIEKEPFPPHKSESTKKFVFFADFLTIVIIMYQSTSKHKTITGKEYGTAEWETVKHISHLSGKAQYNAELKRIKDKKNKATINALKEKYGIEKINRKIYYFSERLFTQTEKLCMYNWELNNNTMVLGGPGSGKTRGYVLPNILQANTSMIITDPKGEILEKVGHFLEIKGYKIRVLNIENFEISDCFNPLYYIHRERNGWEARVDVMTDILLQNTNGTCENNGGGGQDSAFWENAERLFWQAIFNAVLIGFDDKDCNFLSVRKLIDMLDIKEDNDNRDSELDKLFECMEEEYGSDCMAVRQFKTFRSKCVGKTALSVVISAVARIQLLAVPQIERVLSRDDMQLDMVGEEKTALFVIKKPTNDSGNFLAGMLFSFAFSELEYCASTLHAEQKCVPVPVHFYLDEFANTCKIPKFNELLSYARSLGIGITMILQSLSQLKEMYEKKWETIIDDCNTFLYLGGISSESTLKYLSGMIGTGTFEKKNTSKSKGRQSSFSTSYDKFGRKLMDESEIQRLKKDNCLLRISGYNVFKSKKYNYKKHPNYKYTSDKDPKNFYRHIPLYITEQQQKEKILKEQEIQVQNERLQKEKEETVKREIDNIIRQGLIEVNINQQETIDKLKTNLINCEIVDGIFENDDLFTEQTLEDKTNEEIIDFMTNAEREEVIESNVKDITINITDVIFKDMIEPMLDSSAVQQTLENLKNDDVIDVGKEEELQANENNEIPHGEEDDFSFLPAEEYNYDDEEDYFNTVMEVTNLETDLTGTINKYSFTHDINI